MMLSPQLGCSNVKAVKGIWHLPQPVWPFVKYVHQLESVAIRQTWCEHVRRSICWHIGQRYVINSDFTLHWIELAMLATTSLPIHPIKTSLFIYLQRQPPDMLRLNPPHTFQTNLMTIFPYLHHKSRTHSILQAAFYFCLDKFTHFALCIHVCTYSV